VDKKKESLTPTTHWKQSFCRILRQIKTQPYNKCHKVASIACVNKLLKCLFHLNTHILTYNYEIASATSQLFRKNITYLI